MKYINKIIYIICFFTIISCVDIVNESVEKIKENTEDIKVINNVWLTKHPDNQLGYVLVKKNDESSGQTIIDESIIQLDHNNKEIFVVSLFRSDTNFCIISLNDKTDKFEVQKTDKFAYFKLLNSCNDCVKINIPK